MLSKWIQYYNERYLKWVLWLCVTIAWVGILLESTSQGKLEWGEMVGETGELTWYLLMFTVFISLLHKLFPTLWIFNNVVPLRKHTGILAWVIALTHGGSEMINRGIAADANAIYNTALSLEDGMVFGAISFLIMLPLFLTSTDFAVQKMGYKWWKRLHKLTHAAFIFAAVHILVLKYQQEGELFLKTTGALTFYFVGYAVVFWRGMKKKSGDV
ncbi:MAG: hypothetical protein HOG89_00590 [Candidatus Peribacter sp.]|jgi:DMSO/TMAO reductase YedYZ heme-binding membrane subunit|nr:hypothetical protein [Candidatus Peribacter sp.]MBT4392978.1 hypothetical protein [Candidatus Peribacter sp.]MBT4601038.1 hypothetical protein [Candidatus Peribacter sp.]MBT5149600.1 hypothetical protein [Candidatus Peribacter sp.]MBT5637474.1 hypothetical protein [Candidatus Peribacter sp.]